MMSQGWSMTRFHASQCKHRERPDSGFAAGARCDGGMPPALRNHRAPTAGDTPAPTAASSLEHPAAMAAQK